MSKIIHFGDASILAETIFAVTAHPAQGSNLLEGDRLPTRDRVAVYYNRTHAAFTYCASLTEAQELKKDITDKWEAALNDE